MILTKLKDFVGITENDDYEEEYEEMDWEQEPNSQASSTNQGVSNHAAYNHPGQRDSLNYDSETSLGSGGKNNVIGMPGLSSSIAEVVVIEPHSFDEMPQVVQTLRERKSVVLNLNVMDPEEAQRAVDFVAGGTYAIDGHQERIGESIFLFTPSCVKVSTLSGIVHDVPESPKANNRQTSPAAAWGTTTASAAQ